MILEEPMPGFFRHADKIGEWQKLFPGVKKLLFKLDSIICTNGFRTSLFLLPAAMENDRDDCVELGRYSYFCHINAKHYCIWLFALPTAPEQIKLVYATKKDSENFEYPFVIMDASNFLENAKRHNVTVLFESEKAALTIGTEESFAKGPDRAGTPKGATVRPLAEYVS